MQEKYSEKIISYIKYLSLIIVGIAAILSSLMGLWLGKAPGYLLLSSNPTGAQITIDGISHGKTPADIKLKPSKYKVILSKTGYQVSEKLVELKAKKSQSLTFSLMKGSSLRLTLLIF